jgi:hypothetical protein
MTSEAWAELRGRNFTASSGIEAEPTMQAVKRANLRILEDNPAVRREQGERCVDCLRRLAERGVWTTGGNPL